MTVNATTPPSSPTTSVGAVTVAQPSETVTESSAVPTAQAVQVNAASSALATQTVAAATALAVPTAQVATPAYGLVGFLNGIVTNLLNPFLRRPPTRRNPAHQ